MYWDGLTICVRACWTSEPSAGRLQTGIYVWTAAWRWTNAIECDIVPVRRTVTINMLSTLQGHALRTTKHILRHYQSSCQVSLLLGRRLYLWYTLPIDPHPPPLQKHADSWSNSSIQSFTPPTAHRWIYGHCDPDRFLPTLPADKSRKTQSMRAAMEYTGCGIPCRLTNSSPSADSIQILICNNTFYHWTTSKYRSLRCGWNI